MHRVTHSFSPLWQTLLIFLLNYTTSHPSSLPQTTSLLLSLVKSVDPSVMQKGIQGHWRMEVYQVVMSITQSIASSYGRNNKDIIIIL